MFPVDSIPIPNTTSRNTCAQSRPCLNAGMYAKVRFRAPTEVRLPIVPATTLQTRADGDFIYTVNSEKRAHMHKLVIARDMGGKFEVFKGIAIGDTVIVNPPDDIQDSMLVNPVPIAQSESKPEK